MTKCKKCITLTDNQNGCCKWHQPDGDEPRILELVRQRLELGKTEYGTLNVSSDKRNFKNETIEELLDAVIYLAAELIRRQ